MWNFTQVLNLGKVTEGAQVTLQTHTVGNTGHAHRTVHRRRSAASNPQILDSEDLEKGVKESI